MRRLAPVLSDLLAAGEAVALVTIADARGSTPREAGTRMLVTGMRCFGTIGGGRLEYDAIQEARRLLETGAVHALREVPLGPALGQCCGGHATVLLERAARDDVRCFERLAVGAVGVLATRLDQPAPRVLLAPAEVRQSGLPLGLEQTAARVLKYGVAERVDLGAAGTWLVEPSKRALPEVLLFGAGHVGRALATALAPLPCRVHWIDDRAELFVEPAPESIEVVLTDHPLDQVDAAPAGAFFLVMTPSHDLDCAICEVALRRGDFAFLGLIGSATKRARFEKRWRARGVPEERISRLVCPIGLPAISGKSPEVIAASTAAQLLMAFDQRASAGSSRAQHEPAEALA
jgi:xanthine dehydrogenase accessory factor